jgi:hypothetical protein
MQADEPGAILLLVALPASVSVAGLSDYLISPCGAQANELADISDGRVEFSAVYARH